MILEVQGPVFFSHNDEVAMFAWLDRIKAVGGVSGQGRSVLIDLKNDPGEQDLRDLVALFHRYHMDMSVLARLRTVKNERWFADRAAYWYEHVFGG